MKILRTGLALLVAVNSTSVWAHQRAPVECKPMLDQAPVGLAPMERILAARDRDTAVRTAVEELNKTSLSVSQSREIVAALSILLAQIEIEQDIQIHEKRVRELVEAIDAAKQCGDAVTVATECAVNKLKIAREKIAMFFSSFWKSGTTKQAQRQLADAIKSMPPTYRLIREPGDAGADEEIYPLPVPALENLDAALRSPTFTLSNFWREVKAGGRRFNLWKLRENPAAWTEFWRTYGTVTAYQFLGQALVLVPQFMGATPMADAAASFMTDPSWQDLANFAMELSRESHWNIFAVTFLMMVGQAGMYGEKQTVDSNPNQRHLANFTGLLKSLPSTLHGRQGYWIEGKEKVLGFFSMLIYELPLAILAAFGRDYVNWGTGEAMDRLPMTALETTVALGIFGTILAYKIGYMQKPINMALLANYRKGTSQVAQDSLDYFLKVNADQGLDPGMNFASFTQLYNRYTRSDAIRQQGRMVRAAIRLWVARNGARLGLSGRLRAAVDVENSDQFDKALVEEIFSTAEARTAFEKIQSARQAGRSEWAWRFLDGGFDAYVLFGMFKNVSPAISKGVARHAREIREFFID